MGWLPGATGARNLLSSSGRRSGRMASWKARTVYLREGRGRDNMDMV